MTEASMNGYAYQLMAGSGINETCVKPVLENAINTLNSGGKCALSGFDNWLTLTDCMEDIPLIDDQDISTAAALDYYLFNAELALADNLSADEIHIAYNQAVATYHAATSEASQFLEVFGLMRKLAIVHAVLKHETQIIDAARQAIVSAENVREAVA